MSLWDFIKFMFDPLGWDAPSEQEERDACEAVRRGKMSLEEFYRRF